MPNNIDRTQHCPNCGQRLLKVTKELHYLALENQHLVAENQQMKADLAELEDLLAHMDVHTYVASLLAPHFHRPECKWAREISPTNWIVFPTHGHAVEAGKKPCKTCRA